MKFTTCIDLKLAYAKDEILWARQQYHIPKRIFKMLKRYKRDIHKTLLNVKLKKALPTICH